jgi:hypothetical protein
MPNKILKIFRNRLFGQKKNILYFSTVFMN